jgi:dynein heavy chain, axonemal
MLRMGCCELAVRAGTILQSEITSSRLHVVLACTSLRRDSTVPRVQVVSACMILTAPGGKIPKDVSWNAGKKSMGNVDTFLKSLVNFDKDNVPENCVAAVERARTSLLLVHVTLEPAQTL